MRVLFFEPFTINIPHYGTCLELMIDHLKKGDEVWFLGCEADYKACDVNTTHSINICMECRDRGLGGLKKLSKYGKVKSLKLKDFVSIQDQKLLEGNYQFADIEALKKFSFDDFYDLGFGVASSIISMTRDPSPDTIILSDLINRFIYSAKLSYIAISRVINEIKFDRVYAYNGRYASLRPALRVCQKNNVEIFLHEAGSDLFKYFITTNEMMHDIPVIQKEINELWEDDSEPLDVKMKKAHEFYSLSRDGVVKNWFSFTDYQKNELPVDWNDNNYNVVFFTTSEDEFASIGDSWIYPIYKTQVEGIKEIANELKNEKDLKIWVRLHPNLKAAPEKLINPYLEIDNPVVNIIMPSETVSTYLLMEKADKVVTFGSTTGIEAAYWGKVSIMLGTCWYKELGSVYEPKSHQEAVSMILNKDLQPLDKLGASKYGYFIGNYGKPYKYFKKTGIYTGVIEGWDFAPSKKLRFINKLRNRGILNEHSSEKAFNKLIG